MIIFIIIALIATSWARSFRNPMENPDLFQGDIIGMDYARDRNALPDDSDRWPDGIIHYSIDAGLDHLKDDIEKAMEYISERTCIKFEPRDWERDYIRIFHGDGCYSLWGKGGGAQALSLGDGCDNFGTITHELIHAIGFDHEQNRSDRDDYLIIYFHNIDPDFMDQFDKSRPFQNRLINGFDYQSIMLYGEKAFSIDGIQKTMKAKEEGVQLLEVSEKTPSDSDIERINILYNCEK